jgi:hypothetical protein
MKCVFKTPSFGRHPHSGGGGGHNADKTGFVYRTMAAQYYVSHEGNAAIRNVVRLNCGGVFKFVNELLLELFFLNCE